MASVTSSSNKNISYLEDASNTLQGVVGSNRAGVMVSGRVDRNNAVKLDANSIHFHCERPDTINFEHPVLGTLRGFMSRQRTYLNSTEQVAADEDDKEMTSQVISRNVIVIFYTPINAYSGSGSSEIDLMVEHACKWSAVKAYGPATFQRVDNTLENAVTSKAESGGLNAIEIPDPGIQIQINVEKLEIVPEADGYVEKVTAGNCQKSTHDSDSKMDYSGGDANINIFVLLFSIVLGCMVVAKAYKGWTT